MDTKKHVFSMVYICVNNWNNSVKPPSLNNVLLSQELLNKNYYEKFVLYNYSGEYL